MLDKLHKLYSSTSEPVVWARSVGLEVLNEFDTVKAAIMMSAGAKKGVAGPGWSFVAKGVEGLGGGLEVAKVVGRGVAGMINAGLSGLLKASQPEQKR